MARLKVRPLNLAEYLKKNYPKYYEMGFRNWDDVYKYQKEMTNV